MKKRHLSAAMLLALAATMPLTSCIGNFTLTKRLLNWNQNIGGKFANEVVFFCFSCIIPAYEVTAVIDFFILNSIEFWSGTDPMAQSTKAIDTDHGRYLIACDGTGYDITAPDGNVTRLNFHADSQTWALETAEGELPFMTFVDPHHVKVLTPEGTMTPVELSEQGVLAYRQAVNAPLMALR